MMPAAKMLDPVLGVDIHLIQPPGPVPPVPIPHPFIGLLFDPMELAPFIGATVFVNGMPKATAGSEGRALPPHIPLGGIFVPPPPGNECEMFMGSATVLFEGEPASYLALPALSCQSIGMPSPPRKKKKPKPILKLPTSVVLAIPMGAPVLIGGPPTISMSVIGMKLAMGAAGKAAGKLRKLQKSSKKVKAVSDRIHQAAKKAMDKLGVPPSAQNKVHKGICTVTGHPVDVATGKVFTVSIDFRIGGSHPVQWERTWYSTSGYRGALGHGWHHAYDMALTEDGSAVAVRMPDGRPAAFPRLEGGQSHFLRAEKAELFKDEKGYGLRVRGDRTYRFARAATSQGIHPLARIESPSGEPHDFEYDGNGLLLGIRIGGGRRLIFIYDRGDRIAEIRAASAGQAVGGELLVRYAYDEKGDMVEAADACGKSWRYAYQNHLLVRETNRNGLSFHFEYEGRDTGARCTRTVGDGGILDRKLEYDLANGTTVVTDGLGHTVTHRWNDQGVVFETRDARGAVYGTVYNDFNEVVKDVDALGLAMEYAFDDRGNCTGIRNADGASLELVFEGDLPVAAKDSMGGEWTWEYDREGRVLGKSDPLGRVTRYEYQGPYVARKTEPNGGVTSFAYDAWGNLVSMKLPDGSECRWKYDWLGRCIETIDAYGNVRNREYDACGRLVRMEEPDGGVRSMEYDGEGNVVAAKDPHREVFLEYQGLNRLASRIENGARVVFLYDKEERVIGIRNEQGDEYRFELDPNGDTLSESDFSGARKRYTRDAKGRIVAVERDGGRISEYAFDAGDRIVETRHGGEYRETRKYRADGLLVEAENPSIKVVFERDILGRVVKEIQGQHSVTTEFDTAGHRKLVESSLGSRVAYSRNALGEILSVTAEDAAGGSPWSASFKRDDWGRELERTLPGGLKSIWKRDRLGRPLAQKLWSPHQTRAREYTWQMSERLEEIQDTAWGSTMFGYDASGNLAWALEKDGWIRRRTADEVGNLYASEDRSDRKYGPGGRILEARNAEGTVMYEHDAEGNLAKKVEPGGKSWAYRWDPAGRLEAVTRPDGEEVRFAYDPLGRRISKSYRQIRTRWVWNGPEVLHEWTETAASAPASPPGRGTGKSTITWVFEPGTFSPMAKLVDGARYSILSDHLGTPVSMSDAGGKEVWSAKVGILGGLEASKGDRQACPFRFPGQYEDPETGLHYNRYRYYDSELGRYISKDPIGLLGGLRYYAYVSDPNMWVDYYGLAFQRPYTQEETSQILDDSEGRPSPRPPHYDGHPRGKHVNQTNADMTHRVRPGGGGPQVASTFESRQSQDRATTAALNSPEGQAGLAELDANPGQDRVVINADTPPETMRHARRHRGYIVRETSRRTTVVVDVLDRTPGAERIHIQTCVPR